MARFAAACTRGLEEFAASEIKAKANGSSNFEIKEGIIFFDFEGDYPVLLSLRQIDDIFVLIKMLTGITRYRHSLNKIRKQAAKSDFSGAIEIIRKIRRLHDETFSVDADYIGRRDYKEKEIEDAAADSIANLTGFGYLKEGFGSLHYTVILRPDIAFIGMSAGNLPLHIASKIITVPGSLKNSIACTMLEIAEAGKKDIVIDPMCGSGVIPLEAAKLGAKAVAGDIDAERIEIAKKNCEGEKDIELHVWDAADTKLKDNLADKIISNLPFGKQAAIAGFDESFFDGFLKEMIRVSKEGAIFVFLTRHKEAITKAARNNNLEISAAVEINNSGLSSSVIKIKKIKQIS